MEQPARIEFINKDNEFDIAALRSVRLDSTQEFAVMSFLKAAAAHGDYGKLSTFRLTKFLCLALAILGVFLVIFMAISVSYQNRIEREEYRNYQNDWYLEGPAHQVTNFEPTNFSSQGSIDSTPDENGNQDPESFTSSLKRGKQIGGGSGPSGTWQPSGGPTSSPPNNPNMTGSPPPNQTYYPPNNYTNSTPYNPGNSTNGSNTTPIYYNSTSGSMDLNREYRAYHTFGVLAAMAGSSFFLLLLILCVREGSRRKAFENLKKFETAELELLKLQGGHGLSIRSDHVKRKCCGCECFYAYDFAFLVSGGRGLALAEPTPGPIIAADDRALYANDYRAQVAFRDPSPQDASISGLYAKDI